MDASHLIAQILGLVYVVMGIGILIDANRYKQLFSELQSSAFFSCIGGMMALVTGYLIITFGPNVWEFSVEGLLTLIGWIALIKGVLFLIRPSVLMSGPALFWSKNMPLAAGVCIILGLVIGYYGFA